jgi:phosphatidylserine/phosphatidylglycerophosphate/cardiolipin synthase-like enzyme
MPQFLSTKQIASELEQLIKNAEEFICLFSFSLKIDAYYIKKLREASNRGVKIYFVLGVTNGSPDTIKALKEINNCNIRFYRDLHAKLFYSDKALVISSMNLSQVSESNNVEFGVSFNRNENPEIYQRAIKEGREILKNSDPWSSEIPQTPTFTISKGLKGKCIRCSWSIPLNSQKPYCYRCYDEWSYWENPYYKENFCHKCGKNTYLSTTINNPLCNSCKV